MIVLFACEDEDALEKLSTGKIVPDASVQIDLEQLSEVDLHNDYIVVQRKVRTEKLRTTEFDLDVIRTLNNGEMEIVQVPSGVNTLEFVKELRDSGEYTFVEPNIIYDNPGPPVDVLGQGPL